MIAIGARMAGNDHEGARVAELTEEQRKNSAASLRSIADLLEPPIVTTPPAGGGSTLSPTGFAGRTRGDSEVWKQQASFEENFPILTPRGKFLDIYKMWAPTPSTT
jgi:hypothetical protein